MIVDRQFITPNIRVSAEQKLSNFKFGTDDIVKIIKSSDPNKGHVHNRISI